MDPPRPLSEADLDLLRRLERVPFGRFQRRLLWMGGLGYTFDASGGALIAFLLPAVTALWGLTSEQTGVPGSSAMIGSLFAAFFAPAPIRGFFAPRTAAAPTHTQRRYEVSFAPRTAAVLPPAMVCRSV